MNSDGGVGGVNGSNLGNIKRVGVWAFGWAWVYYLDFKDLDFWV